MSQTILITGANRGIGLELARAWHQRGDQVIAVCRQRSDALGRLGVEVLDGIDVTRDSDIQRLRDALRGRPLDILYHNAGILGRETLDHMDIDRVREQFEVNTLAPLRLTLALLDNLNPGSKIGLMSSILGSIALNEEGGYYGYRISKAALNAAGRTLSVDLRPRGIAVGLLHPGYVMTDMTGHQGHISPQVAAERLVARMDELSLENTGHFWHAEGRELLW